MIQIGKEERENKELSQTKALIEKCPLKQSREKEMDLVEILAPLCLCSSMESCSKAAS
jgi:hypothetical protein